MKPQLLSTVALLALAWLGGCATYESDFRYFPRPIELAVEQPPASPAQPVHVLTTVVGLRTSHAKPFPNTVEVGLHIENFSPAPVVFDPAAPGALELFSADLQRFHPATTDLAGPTTIATGQAVTFSAYFPFDGLHEVALDGLNLRWRFRLGEATVLQNATFTRRARYYGPYYEDPFGPHIRIGIGFHRRF